MASITSETGRSSWPSYNAQPFRSDGGFSFSGLAILTLISCLTGGVIGLFAGFISQWFFLVVLFPIGMGVVIGAVGAYGVKVGKVRMPIVCGTAGFLGGCVAVLAMHGFEYYQFELELADVPAEIRKLARDFDRLQPQLNQLDPDTQDVLKKLAADQEMRQGLAVHDLLSFVDLKAHQGVEISRAKGGGGKGVNLGYTGSYIYWGVELFMIAGFAFALMKGAAEEPYCTSCDTWKKSEPISSFLGSPIELKDSLIDGNLSAIQTHVGPGDTVNALVFACPNCGSEAPIDVRLDKITVNSKGESSTTTLCTVTYPGEALESVREVFVAAQNKPLVTLPEDATTKAEVSEEGAENPGS